MMPTDTNAELDLGDGHALTFTCFRPDRALNPQYHALPDTDRLGAIVRHVRPNGTVCEGIIFFDCPQAHAGWPSSAKWRVECADPLTLSPSLLCHCGDHGFIRGGKWVRA